MVPHRLVSSTSFIADTTDRHNNFRIFWVFLNLGPESLYVNVNKTRIGGMIVSPHVFKERLAAENTTRLRCCLLYTSDAADE